jgi:hypothetical protein
LQAGRARLRCSQSTSEVSRRVLGGACPMSSRPVATSVGTATDNRMRCRRKGRS